MPMQDSEAPFQWPLQRVTLRGYSVGLVPVDYSHLDQLSRWSTEEDVWRYMTFAPRIEGRNANLDRDRMETNFHGTELNFTIIDEMSE